MNTPIVSFYRDILGKTFFSDSASAMVERCEELGIPHYIKSRDYGSTWWDNVRGKPTFLLETFDTLQKPFLWVDVDSIIGAVPDEVDSFTDVGFASVPEPPHYVLRMMDCTHYVGTSPLTRKLLVEWKERCDWQVRKGNPGCKGHSHHALHRILRSGKYHPRLNFRWLPSSYGQGPVIKLGVSRTHTPNGKRLA
jgi:hypothetical protein